MAILTLSNTAQEQDNWAGKCIQKNETTGCLVSCRYYC